MTVTDSDYIKWPEKKSMPFAVLHTSVEARCGTVEKLAAAVLSIRNQAGRNA